MSVTVPVEPVRHARAGGNISRRVRLLPLDAGEAPALRTKLGTAR